MVRDAILLPKEDIRIGTVVFASSSKNQGPGIADVDLALTDGYTSGTRMGLGLGGPKRLSHEFEIASKVGEVEMSMTESVLIPVQEPSQTAEARRVARKMAAEIGFSENRMEEVSIVVIVCFRFFPPAIKPLIKMLEMIPHRDFAKRRTIINT